MTIRLRLALLYALVFGFSLLVGDLLVYVGLERYLAAELDRALASQSSEIAGTTRLESSLAPGGGRVLSVVLPDLDVFASPGLYVQVINRSGQLQARSGNLGQAQLPTGASALASAAAGSEVFETTTVGDTRFRVYYRPLRLGQEVVGVLELARSRRDLDITLGQLRLTSLGIAVASLFFGSVTGWWLAGAALRPIDRLTRAARAVGQARDFTRRVGTGGSRDEVGRLATTFNEMLAELEAAHAELAQSLSAEQRFVADASHEMRTPLATIRANLELIQRVADLNENDRQASLEDALSEVDRLGRLVADLLTLARADAGQHLDLHPVRLDQLLREVHRQARLLALRREQRVELELPSQAWVEGNADALRQLMLILVDNAVKYSSDGAEVRLSLAIEGRRVRLEVSDDGPGIPPQYSDEIFERFFRVDQARAGGGTGLGLAIARWIAEEHGGRLSVSQRPTGGSTFTFELATVQPPANQPQRESAIAGGG